MVPGLCGCLFKILFDFMDMGYWGPLFQGLMILYYFRSNFLLKCSNSNYQTFYRSPLINRNVQADIKLTRISRSVISSQSKYTSPCKVHIKIMDYQFCAFIKGLILGMYCFRKFSYHTAKSKVYKLVNKADEATEIVSVAYSCPVCTERPLKVYESTCT